MSTEETPLEIVYEGKDVNDGTMPVEDMIDALVGFSSAYNKLAYRQLPNEVHRIRVVGIRKDSTHILLDLLEFTKANPQAAGVLSTVGLAAVAGAYKIVKDIAKYVDARIHTKGKLAGELKVVFEGPNIFILNETGHRLELTKEQYEYLQSGLLDADLDKLTAPLKEGAVDRVKLKSNKEILTKVEAKESVYFRRSERPATSSKDDVWMEGTLNSFSKDKGKGTFHTTSGRHIPYRYVGTDRKPLLEAFAYEGMVQARSKVTFDKDLNPTSLEIHDIRAWQPNLFPGKSKKKR